MLKRLKLGHLVDAAPADMPGCGRRHTRPFPRTLFLLYLHMFVHALRGGTLLFSHLGRDKVSMRELRQRPET
jgi:hypothetical protein